MAIPPIVFTMDYRVKNENSFIRSVNLAQKSTAQAAVDAQKAAIANEKLAARLDSVKLRYDNLRLRTAELQQSLQTHTTQLDPLTKKYDQLAQSIARYELVLKQAGRSATGKQWDQTRESLARMKGEYDKLTPQIQRHQTALSKESRELQYVTVQLAQRVARMKELDYQMKASAPVQQKQLTFFQSMGQSLKRTFASWENFVAGVEKFSVTADRLTRSGQRTINIINKISGAITGKPLLDWDKGATKAATSTTHFGNSAEKAQGGIKGLASRVTEALNPIKGISTATIAAGTALGNLASKILSSVVSGFAQMGQAALMAAQNIARSAISNVSNYERSVKSLTALLAQEKAVGNAYEQTGEQQSMSAEDAKKLTTEQRKLTLELQLQEESLNAAKGSGELFGAQLELQEISVQENRDRLAEMTAELGKYNVATAAAAGNQNVMAKATGTVRDNLKAAGPEAAELLRWIEKLAIESPFTQEGVQSTFMMLKSFGFMAADAKKMTTALIDWSAATGKTSFDMERVALALSQIKNLGRLSGQEVMQLAQAGISVDRILAQSMGKTTQEIVQMRQKGLIPAQKAIDLIIKQLETDWQGAAKDQAKTFSGLLSSIQDIVPILTRSFFGPMDQATGKIGGLFGAIQPYISKFVDFIGSEAVIGKVREWGIRLGDWVTNLLEKGIPRLQEFGGKVVTVFQTLQAKAQPYIDGVRKAINTVMNIIKGGTVEGGGEGKGFSGLFKAMETTLPKAIQTAKTAFDTLKIVVGEVGKTWENILVPAVRRIAGLFQVDWDQAGRTATKVMDFLQASMAKVSEFVVLKLMPVVSNLINYVSTNFPIWKTVAEDAFNTFVQKAQPVVTAVQNLWAEFQKSMPAIRDLISTTIDTIKMTWDSFFGTLDMNTKYSLDEVIQGITGALKGIQILWQMYGDDVIAVVQLSLKTLVTIFGAGMAIIRGALNAVHRFMIGDWKGAMDEIFKGNQTALKMIKQNFKMEFLALETLWDNTWRGIHSDLLVKWAQIKTAAKNFIWNVRDTIRNALYELKDQAVNATNVMKDGIVDVWKDISFEVKSVYYGLENALKLAWSRLRWDAERLWEDVKETIRRKWDEIYDKVMYYVNLVKGVITNPYIRYEFMNAASNWIGSMINELMTWAWPLYNAVYNLVRQAVNAAKNAFLMHSPSKVGIEIGQNFAQSIILGIASQMPQIEKAVGTIQVALPARASQVAAGAVTNVSQITNQNLTVNSPAPANIRQDFAILRSLNTSVVGA